MSLPIYETITRLLQAGRTIAVATVVERQGSTPSGFGAKMIVTDSGGTEFTIGGGAFESMVIEDAREAIRSGNGFEKEYRFAEQGANALGMVCGGRARVLFEVVRPPQPLFVFGAGHIGREVVRLCVHLGFEVTLIDDRAGTLRPDCHPEGIRLVCAQRDFSENLPAIPAGAFVVIVTRCHQTDLAAVRHSVGRDAAYVGLIGSRRKIEVIRARAEEAGTSRESLSELRAPIGLRIGADTPTEIAVSIAAEMIAVRHGAKMESPSARVTAINEDRSIHAEK